MSQPAEQATPPAETLAGIREMVRACLQCGTCTASCANSWAMDLLPRQVWRMLQTGLTEDLLVSKTFWLCSACYYCTLRCPRGLPLTEAMAALKRVAVNLDKKRHQKSAAFYRNFTDNIRRYGRVQETDMMLHYFLAMKNPLLPLDYTPLGLKLMLKGKFQFLPETSGRGKLEGLFEKVKQMEGWS